MRRIARLARKAITTSPQEWRCRAVQAWFGARNMAEPLLRSAALPSDGHLDALGIDADALPDWWRGRNHRWFLDPARLAALERAYRDGALGNVLERADQVCDGRMPLFSLPPIPFRDAERWHRDPQSGRVAPNLVYPRIPYLSSEIVGDHKMTWEPSRFAWALWLGVAHRVTADDRYLDTFVALSSDWFARNPYPYGIHYCSALEMAFRAYAWLWALALFAPALAQQSPLLERLLAGIWTSCRHVETNLSTYFSPNTHLSGEAFCLFAAGAAIPEWSGAARWRALGSEVLETESHRQFHADGTHRELSTAYHLYSTDFYLQACLIAEETGFPLWPEARETARRLCDRLTELAPADLVLPQCNDCDGGRLLHLGEHALDAAPTLWAAAALWPDLESPRGFKDRAGYALLMAPPRPEPARFSGGRNSTPSNPGARDSGVVAHRNEHGDYLMFRATEFGYMDCPHSHDAPLSFLLFFAGRPIVVDSGTGAYGRDLALRNIFRAAPGKNVLLLDGRGPSEPGSRFGWDRKTDARSTHAEAIRGGLRCGGSHRGFSAALGHRVLVERSIEFDDRGIVSITDRWEAARPVTPSLCLTLAPGLRIDLTRRVIESAEGVHAHFHCEARPGAAKLSAERVQFSPNYGSVEDTEGLRIALVPSRSGSLVTSLSRNGPICGEPEGDGS